MSCQIALLVCRETGVLVYYIRDDVTAVMSVRGKVACVSAVHIRDSRFGNSIILRRKEEEGHHIATRSGESMHQLSKAFHSGEGQSSVLISKFSVRANSIEDKGVSASLFCVFFQQ